MPAFSSGAGCEAGFYQAFDQAPPNNMFALEFDSWAYLGSVQSFSYSSVQIYQSGQSPCNPNDSGPGYVLIDKISTSPVPLNSPASSQGTSTGDTYSATVTYDGNNLTLNMYDVTAGGSCPGTRCFTYTWSNVNIPSLVGANTAWVGFTAGTEEVRSTRSISARLAIPRDQRRRLLLRRSLLPLEHIQVRKMSLSPMRPRARPFTTRPTEQRPRPPRPSTPAPLR